MGFAGQTERQLPSAEQRRCPLPWQEQRPKETPKPCCVSWVHSEDRVRGGTLSPCRVCRPKWTQPFIHSPPAYLGGCMRTETPLWTPRSVRRPHNRDTYLPGKAADSLGNATYSPAPQVPWAGLRDSLCDGPPSGNGASSSYNNGLFMLIPSSVALNLCWVQAGEEAGSERHGP